MILKEKRSASKVEVANKHQFTAAQSAKAFQIISRMYTDPVMAICRELMCNAYDSQKEKGIVKPAEFTIPDRSSNVFSIRDYGTGMTDEVIKTVYSTMFESSKTHSNEYTGCLGIGALSIFAIVDEFTVETYVDGTHTMWLVFKEDGIPTLSQIFQKSTSEEDGVKITANIDPKYHTDFKRSALESFRHFNPTPIGNVTINPPEYILQDQKFGISSSGFPVVLMGNVAYNINVSALGLGDAYSFSHSSCVMYFDIGDLDFTPSREELEITPKTKAKIIDRWQYIKKVINDLAQEKIDACINLYEARLTKENLSSMHGVPVDVSKLRFNGELIKNYRYEELGFTLYNDRNKPMTNVYKLFKLVVNDLTRGAYVRAKQNYNHTGFYLINPEDVSKACEFFGFSEEYALEKNLLVYASKLEYEKKKSVSRKTAKVSLFRPPATHGRQYVTTSWSDDADLSTAVGYYIELDRYHGMYDNTKYSIHDLDLLSKFISEFDTAVNLYGIRKNVSKKYYTHLKPFIPHAKTIYENISSRKFEYASNYCNAWFMKHLPATIQKINEQCKKLYADRYTHHKQQSRFERIKSLVKSSKDIEYIDLHDTIQKELDKFPLVTGTSPDHLNKYIQLVLQGVFQ